MARLPLLALLLLSCAAAAAPTPAPKQGPVDPALLEFLADWQATDGSWVDPMTFSHIDPAKVRADVRSPVPPPAPVSAAPGSQAR